MTLAPNPSPLGQTGDYRLRVFPLHLLNDGGGSRVPDQEVVSGDAVFPNDSLRPHGVSAVNHSFHDRAAQKIRPVCSDEFGHTSPPDVSCPVLSAIEHNACTGEFGKLTKSDSETQGGIARVIPASPVENFSAVAHECVTTNPGGGA